MIFRSNTGRSLLKEWPKSIPDRQAYVDPIFATIARKYDFMKKMLSLGQELRWKAKTIHLIPKNGKMERILDLASGTGDFPLYLRKNGFQAPIIGVDRNPKMLGVAMQRCAQKPVIRFVQGDLMQIPLKDNSFDVITMGYGLRYVTDIGQTLREVFRLLRTGGIFVCLDFGVPKNLFLKRISFGYLLLFGTFWGIVLHGKKDIYWHIVESLNAYPGQESVKNSFQEVGFTEIKLHEHLGGIIAIVSGRRS